MSPRDTGTGYVLESMILPALNKGRYSHNSQEIVGTRLGGAKHRVDVVATDQAGSQFLISLKWQQSGGTAEQKVPFEVLCLIDAIKTYPQYRKAYLVLGGAGWTLREFYIKHLDSYLPHKAYVTILTLEQFIALANQAKL